MRTDIFMKQVLFLLLITVAFLQLNAHESATDTCDCDRPQCELTQAQPADIDLNTCSDDDQERKSGYCTCGGKLKFSAKAIATVKDCTLCKGTGLYCGQTCTLCHGAKTITYWDSGYICQSCGTVYDSL